MKYLLDSVILIDHFNDISKATVFLESTQGQCAISVVTRLEVLTGFDARSQNMAKHVLGFFPCLALSQEVADLAADLRREHRWKTPDAIQAALAKHHGLKLVTRNTKDFPPARHPFVLQPYVV
jgi:predicted nucleic acid-binding protein